MFCTGVKIHMPSDQESSSDGDAWSGRLRRRERVNYTAQLATAPTGVSRTVNGATVRYDQPHGKTPPPFRKRNYEKASSLRLVSPGGHTLFSTVRRTRPYRQMCDVEIMHHGEVVSETRLYQSRVEPPAFYLPRSTPKTARTSARVAEAIKPSAALVKTIEAQVSREIVTQAQRSTRNTRRMLGVSAHELYKLHGMSIDMHVEINHLWAHRYGGDTLSPQDQHQIAFAASAALNTLTLVAVESPMAPYIHADEGSFLFEAAVEIQPNADGQSSHIAQGDMQCTWTSPAGTSVRVTMDTANPYVPGRELADAVKILYQRAFEPQAETEDTMRRQLFR